MLLDTFLYVSPFEGIHQWTDDVTVQTSYCYKQLVRRCKYRYLSFPFTFHYVYLQTVAPC